MLNPNMFDRQRPHVRIDRSESGTSERPKEFQRYLVDYSELEEAPENEHHIFTTFGGPRADEEEEQLSHAEDSKVAEEAVCEPREDCKAPEKVRKVEEEEDMMLMMGAVDFSEELSAINKEGFSIVEDPGRMSE